MTEKSRREVIDQLKTALEAENRVKFALLFGSAVRDRLNSESDVDLGVYLDPCPKTWEEKSMVSQVFKNALDRELDVVILNDADPIITMQILNEGELLLNREPAFFVLYKAQKTSEYIDFKRSREPIEKNLLKKGWPKW